MKLQVNNFTFSPDDDFDIKSKYLYNQVVFNLNIKFKQCFSE